MICSLFELRRYTDDVQEHLVCLVQCNQSVYEIFYGVSQRMYGIVCNFDKTALGGETNVSGAAQIRGESSIAV
jgi:hypothetical protein